MMQGEHVNDLLIFAADSCLDFGYAVDPRGFDTLELLGQSFCLLDPRARIPAFEKRRWSLPLAIGEFCWNMRGDTSVEALAYYAPSWRKYSDDGHRISGSCYGNKAFKLIDGHSQWNFCKEILRFDNNSRRAIINFDETSKNDLFTVDKSCLTSMQFFIRDDRLHSIINMRSNDIYVGLPYDIFLFTMMQEFMANELGVGLGYYIHFAASLHLYKKNIKSVRTKYKIQSNRMPMPSMEHLEQLHDFLDAEMLIRSGHDVDLRPFCSYWSDLLKELKSFRALRDAELLHK